MRFVIQRTGIIFREWRFKILSNNNRVLAHSEGYKNKIDCEHAVNLIKTFAIDAKIIVKEDR